MITVNNVSMNFSGQTLFKDVELKFVPGNCYGIIGANGAGKTTFLRILSGELEPSSGEVIIPDNERMSVLKQDHFQYDQYTVLDTVILGIALTMVPFIGTAAPMRSTPFSFVTVFSSGMKPG